MHRHTPDARWSRTTAPQLPDSFAPGRGVAGGEVVSRPFPRHRGDGWRDELHQRLARWPFVARVAQPGLRWLGQGELERAIRALDRADDQLRGMSERLGERFLGLGQGLMAQSAVNRELVRTSGELVTTAVGTNGQSWAVDLAVTLIDDVLKYVEENRRGILELVGQLEEFEQQLTGESVNEDADARQILTSLSTIEVLFRIEVAGMDPRLQSVFATLTAEIRRLQAEVATVFEQHSHTLASSRQCLRQSNERLVVLAKALGEASRQQHAAVDHALAELKHAVALQTERNERLVERARRVDTETDAVVVALQYQDIARQKIEHILAASHDLREKHAARSRGDRAQTVAMVLGLSRIECAQMELLETDLTRTLQSLGSGLERLDQGLQAVEQQVAEMNEDDAVVGLMDRLVKVLLDTFQQVRPLIDRAAASSTEAFAAVQQLRQTATAVTSTMHALSVDIRFLALNAQVQAAQVRSCNALEVLSGQTCAIAEETGRVTAANQAKFERVLAHLPTLIKRCEQLQTRSHEARELLAARGSDAEQQLQNYRATVEGCVQRLGAALARSRGMGKLAADLADTQAEAVAAARGAHEAFGMIHRWASRLQSDAATTVDLSGLTARYTMDSERQAHQRATAALNHPASPAPAPKASNEPVAALAGVAAAAAVLPLREETASTPAEPAPVHPGAASAEASLGENVELF